MKYAVDIEETLYTTVVVEADNEELAKKKAISFPPSEWTIELNDELDPETPSVGQAVVAVSIRQLEDPRRGPEA